MRGTGVEWEKRNIQHNDLCDGLGVQSFFVWSCVCCRGGVEGFTINILGILMFNSPRRNVLEASEFADVDFPIPNPVSHVDSVNPHSHSHSETRAAYIRRRFETIVTTAARASGECGQGSMNGGQQARVHLGGG